MTRTVVKSAECTVAVDSEYQPLIEVLGSLIPRTIIPGFQLASDEQRVDITLTWDSNSREEGITFDENRKELVVRHRPGIEVPKYPLAYTVFYALNRAYQEKGIYRIHGSSVSRDNRGIILTGHEDYGKSRTALNLCLEYGFKLNGDEFILIDSSGRIIDGVPLVQIGREKMKKYFPERHIEIEEEDVERDKVIFDARNAGIFERPSPPVSHIVYGHICPYVPRDVRIQEGDATRRLYENISESIRGHGYVLLDLGCAFPSLDTTDLSKKRVEFAKAIIRGGTKTHFIRNTLEEICKRIDAEVKNEEN